MSQNISTKYLRLILGAPGLALSKGDGRMGAPLAQLTEFTTRIHPAKFVKLVKVRNDENVYMFKISQAKHISCWRTILGSSFTFGRGNHVTCRWNERFLGNVPGNVPSFFGSLRTKMARPNKPALSLQCDCVSKPFKTFQSLKPSQTLSQAKPKGCAPSIPQSLICNIFRWSSLSKEAMSSTSK